MVNDLSLALKKNDINAIMTIIDTKKLTKKKIEILNTEISKKNFLFVLDRLIDNELLKKVYSEEFILQKIEEYEYIIYSIPVFVLLNLMKQSKEILKHLVNSFGMTIIIDTMRSSEDYDRLFDILIREYGLETVLKSIYSIINIERKHLVIKSLIKKISEDNLVLSEKEEEYLSNFFKSFDISWNRYGFVSDISISGWNNFFELYRNINYEGDILDILIFYQKYPELWCYILGKVEESVEVLDQLKNAKHDDLEIISQIINPDLISIKKERDFFSNAKSILGLSNKINTSNKNPNFNPNFITHIPKLGLRYTADLLKYKTEAVKNIIVLIDKGRIEEVFDFINLYERHNVLPFKDKSIHYAFMNYDSYSVLIKELKNIHLNSKDICGLRHVILSANCFNISSYEELQNYETLLKKNLLSSNDTIAKVYGYENWEKLLKDFIGYKLDSIKVLKGFYVGIKTLNPLFGDFPISKEEISLIKGILVLMKSGEKAYAEYINKHLENGYSIYFGDVFRNIIIKVRNLVEDYYNLTFTDISNLDNCQKRKFHGVEIIEMGARSFSFLVHQLKGWDNRFKKYPTMLMNDPSLWNRLEGATTISTSHISELCLKHVDDGDDKIRYLFNHINRDKFLFMFYDDLMVEHGGHCLNPNYERLFITKPDSLDFRTKVSRSSYNEIVLERDDSKPCAIWSLTEFPTEAEVRAAKYFKIPIIQAFIKDYKNRYDTASYWFYCDLFNHPNWDTLKQAYMYSSGDQYQIQDFVNILDDQVNKGILTFEEYRNLLRKFCVEISMTYNQNSTADILKRYLNLREILEKHSLKVDIKFNPENELVFDTLIDKKRCQIIYIRNEDELGLNAKYDRKAANEMIFLFKLRQKLGIDTYNKCEYLDSNSQKVLIKVSESIFWAQDLNKASYENAMNTINQWYNKNIIQEWILSYFIRPNFIETDFPYLCDKLPGGNIFSFLETHFFNNELDWELEIIENLLFKIESISDEEYLKLFQDCKIVVDRESFISNKNDFLKNRRSIIESNKSQSRKRVKQDE